MIWVKSVLVGLAAAILAIVVVTIAVTAWMMNVHFGEGAGGIGAVSLGIIEMVFLPGVIAFAAGFWWSVRLQRRKQRSGA